MKTKYTFLLTIFSCILLTRAYAQPNENFIPNVFNKSPASASFTKYGDYPTNLSSGLPEISIPLYTIESGGLTVPITLSYHASGIKVEQSATWVGLGWTLSSGGTVSRNVVGLADDSPNGFFKYYQRATSLSATQQGDLEYLYHTVVDKNHDNRPDIYSYNIPGNSGKFFFNALNGTAITGYKIEMIPWSPVLIKNTAVRPDLDTAKFSILDEHGNSYVMGNKYREETHTSNTSSRPSEDATTSWMLERMVSQNKRDTISFTYRKQSLQLPDQTGQSLPVEDMSNDINGPTNLNNNWTAFTSNTQTSVSEQDPKEIFFKTGKVVFKISSIARTDLSGVLSYPLDTIQVFAYDFNRKQYESRPQKSIVFKRSYFAVMSGTQGRLKLDGIQVLDKAGSIVQEYKFTYNTTPLPTYNSFSKDFWGYYNGKMDAAGITPYTLIPKTSIIVQPSTFMPNNGPYPRYIGSNDSTSRDPDTVRMQAGILTRIYYPTGGYTNFNYETNRYLDDSAITRFTGGLRLRSIENYSSATATPILKTYKYNTAYPNFITSPVTGYLNYGYFVNSTLAIDYYAAPNSRSKRVRMYYSESSSSLTPTEGNPVTYTSVTEYIGDATTNIGKTDYSYQYNADTYSGASGYTGNPIILDRYFKRGQLLRQADYIRKTDGTYQIAKEELRNYGAFLDGRDTMYNDVGLIVGQRWQSYSSGTPILYWSPISGGDQNALPFASYNIVSGDSYPIATTTKIYDQNDPTKFQSSTVEYKYDNFKHQQVSRIRSIDSKGNTKVTVSKYPADYLIGAATSTNNIVLDSMLRYNMQAELIEKWDSVKNVSTGINAVMGGRLNLYTNINAGIFPYKISKLSVSSPITDFTPAVITSGNIVGDSRYKEIISFDHYDYYNLTQYKPRNANATYIIYDYNHALPIAQVKNVIFNFYNYDNISAYTSFEADGKGNWQFSGMPERNRTAPTGAMTYNLNGAPITFSGITGSPDLSKPHIVSYWSDNSAATVTISSTSYPGTILRTVNGWTLYKHTIPVIPFPSAMTISGNLNIDELKTYPADAQMTTYTYDTNGLKQTTDEKGQVTTYEYDEAQRLKNIKDWQGNIVKSSGYHNYDMTVGNDAIPVTTFTRNNCPPNTVPGTTTYSVAANIYYSLTKASANALAQYDLNTNGQDKANDPANCGCPIQMLTFTVSNSTGISTYQATFTGDNTVYMPINATGNTTKQIPAGTYTLQISVVGTQIKNFKLGNRAVVNGRTATFNNVIIASGSTDLTLSIY